MRDLVRSIIILLTLLLWVSSALAQTVDVTFRFIPDLTPSTVPANLVRVFTPGSFNDWGPNNNGRIDVNAPSQMEFVADAEEYQYTISLTVGQTYTYKIHYHRNQSGSDYVWLSDPLHDQVTGPNNDSVIEITDPFVFQLARHENEAGEVAEVSAGVFGSEDLAALTFEVNGEAQDGLPFYDGETGIFRYMLDTPVPTGSQFKITASDVSGNIADAEVGLIPPTVENAPRPPGVEDGVTVDDSNPSRVTLSIFAPGKSFVHVIGDFNGWEISDDFLMKRDMITPDSVHWWVTIEGLTPGQEYGYQYLINGETRIADLFSEKVLDPSNDSFISSGTYPNLKRYPTGETQGFVSVFNTRQVAFNFSDFERPPQHELVIYELLVRDFLAAHDYETLTDTLDYLDRLGINAIELMPVSEFGGNLNWGYQPQFAMAADKYYGPAEDLKQFVEEAHRRGIAVILDVVYNHQDFPSPLIELYGANDANPYINIPARHPFNVFFDLNHEDSYVQYWLDRANRYWLEEFNIDGYRFDLSKGFTQRNTGGNVGAWSSYDASRVALLQRMAAAVWAVDPSAYISMEHFGESREERELAAYGTDAGFPGMMLWNNMNHTYNEATMGYNSGSNSNFSRAYFGTGGLGESVANWISFMESHDEQWLMYKNIAFGACERSPSGGSACNPALADNFGTYNVRQLPVALDRMKLAGAFFFTLPGPRLMWQFGELGYGYGDRGEQCLRDGGSGSNCPSIAPGRTGEKPIRWDYRQDPLREKLYKTWSALINLRMDHEVFSSLDTDVSLSLNGDIKRIILEHPTMNAYILGNFGVTPSDAVSFDFPSEGIWYEFFSGEERDSAQEDAVVLLPGEVRLYTSEQIDRPEDGLITVATEEGVDLPTSFRLEANYPNPFSRATTIRYETASAGPVRVSVYDVLGRRVAVLVDRQHAAGIHEVDFDARDVPSGTYFYRLEAGSSIHSRPMLILK